MYYILTCSNIIQIFNQNILRKPGLAEIKSLNEMDPFQSRYFFIDLCVTTLLTLIYSIYKKVVFSKLVFNPSHSNWKVQIHYERRRLKLAGPRIKFCTIDVLRWHDRKAFKSTQKTSGEQTCAYILTLDKKNVKLPFEKFYRIFCFPKTHKWKLAETEIDTHGNIKNFGKFVKWQQIPGRFLLKVESYAHVWGKRRRRFLFDDILWQTQFFCQNWQNMPKLASFVCRRYVIEYSGSVGWPRLFFFFVRSCRFVVVKFTSFFFIF